MLEFGADSIGSWAPVNDLLDGHIALVRARIQALGALEKQRVGLRRTCEGDRSRPCAILESFMSAAEKHGCACHP